MKIDLPDDDVYEPVTEEELAGPANGPAAMTSVAGAADIPRPAPDAPMLDLRGMTVRYGRHIALDALDACLHGRAVGLLGPNGAGKSSLIAALLGFVRPAAGEARLLGQRVRSNPALRRQIGYMPENDALIASMSAVRQTCMLAELAGLPPAAALERAHEALFFVGLGEARYRLLGSYSQGMKQLAKLAQAIVHGPRLLILDEPTNSLDPGGRERMLQLICHMRDESDMRILLSSHLLRDVEAICDEVLILKRGRKVHQGPLGEAPQGPSRFLELEVADDAAAFGEALAGLGCEVARHDRRIKTILPAAVGLREIYALAEAGAVQLRRVEFRHDTLEDIFLRAMEVEQAAD